jgi:hypothetical protein
MDEFENKVFDQTRPDSSLQLEEDAIDKNPWSGLFIPIIAGFILMTVQFGFLMLQYILPLIGSALLYLGIRELRGESRWFRIAWYFAIFFLAIYGIAVIIAATYWQLGSAEVLALLIYNVTNVLKNIVLIIFFLAMRQGIRGFFKKAGMAQSTKPLLWVAGILAVPFVGSVLLMGMQDFVLPWYLSLIILGVLVLLGANILDMAKDLDAAGVAAGLYPSYAKNRLGGRGFIVLYLGIVLIPVLVVWING